MKERPILMTTESVKAILDGRKTMTRRVCKQANDWQQHYDHSWAKFNPKYNWWEFKGRSRFSDLIETFVLTCPYGQVGDRLWVREGLYWNTGSYSPLQKPQKDKGYPVFFFAEYVISLSSSDNQRKNIIKHYKHYPSIFMPRWASRITLEITEVRVERLQEITYQDIVAEGVDALNINVKTTGDYLLQNLGGALVNPFYFVALWNKLNAKRGYGWETNPWVWVIKFDNIGVRVK